mmetsp:Transcript_64382/g.119698  ORF Transcript_64382/g.119698 Transcript_64382/m.119698 type:complete len:392 (-) Transcript_64382:165-1340(-)
MVQLSETHLSEDFNSGKADPGRTSLSLQSLLQPPATPTTPSGTTSEDDSSAGRSQPLQPTKRTFQPYHAQSVPRSRDLAKPGKQSTKGDVPLTTMMLRNIPNKYTQTSLIQEIDEAGFSGTYNFFYLPMDVHNRSNVGYAFINFLTSVDAERFQDAFSNHRFSRFSSRKIGSVCAAHVQGLDENLRHLENRAVTQARNDQYRPVVLTPEGRLDFDTALAQAKERMEVKAQVASPPEHKLMPTVASMEAQGACDISVVRQQLDAAIYKLLSVSVPQQVDTSPAPQTVAHGDAVGVEELLTLHRELGARTTEPGKGELLQPPGLATTNITPVVANAESWKSLLQEDCKSMKPPCVKAVTESRWCNLPHPVDDRVSLPPAGLGLTPLFPAPLVQ